MSLFRAITERINRIQPVDNSFEEDQRGKQHRALGRLWQILEEDLPIEPNIVPPPIPKKISMHEEKQLHSKAAELIRQLTTLEEKVAQLCLYQMMADYDPRAQKQIELMIQTAQIGGVLFTGGHEKRQLYLIEQFQKLSKMPLMIGNDFLHSISFYFQEKEIPDLKSFTSLRPFYNLGRAVGALNSRFQVSLQFINHQSKLSEQQQKEFCRGVFETGGVIGRQCMKGLDPHRLLPTDHRFHTLFVVDCTQAKSFDDEWLKKGWDVLIFSDNLQEGIEWICNAVRTGKIKESDINKRLMKLMALKTKF